MRYHLSGVIGTVYSYLVSFLNDPDSCDGVCLSRVATSLVQAVVASVGVGRANEVVPLVQILKYEIPRVFLIRYIVLQGCCVLVLHGWFVFR